MCRENLIDYSNYVISEDGRIYSIHYHRYFKGTIQSNGYLQVKMTCKDGIRRPFGIHRVIWFYFKGEIPENLQVNHINENKLDNSIFNLNLLTPPDNSNWGTRNERLGNTRRNDPRFSQKLLRINPINGETKEYPSFRQAEREGFNRVCIRKCIDGLQEQSMGYKWKLILT